jgi:hypothetical protein
MVVADELAALQAEPSSWFAVLAATTTFDLLDDAIDGARATGRLMAGSVVHALR